MVGVAIKTKKMASDYESIQLVKPEAFIYNIPPRASTTRGVRAADWNLGEPDWKGRLKIVSKGNDCLIKLEDRSGDLFAICPVDSFPGLAVEPVTDSSRYFVLRLKDPSGRQAFVGLGFQDRGDAFDFNVALQEHFKVLKRDKQIEQEAAAPQPAVDYSLKQGEKISVKLEGKVNFGGDKPTTTKPLIGISSQGGLLPPPGSSNTGRPAVNKLPPPPGASSGSSSSSTTDDWGDFFGATSTTTSSTTNSSSTGGSGWVQF